MTQEKFNPNSVDAVLAEIRTDVKAIKEDLPKLFARTEELEGWKNRAIGVCLALNFATIVASILVAYFRK